ncbi:MAG: histidine kinase [Crocinitomicaceae bacterium]|jgi:two-component system sensor kinase FixL|nr:histidine kinase [Crocinitomicaceae bacterium]
MEVKEVFQALFLHSTEGILVVDSKGKIIRINPSAEKMFGYDKDELLGQGIETGIPLLPASQPGENFFYTNPLPRSMGTETDLSGKRKDGSEFSIEISLSPYLKDDAAFVVVFVFDITIRKKNEQDVIQKKKELELLTEHLKESNLELENFAYISSHDLQEPLRKIQSFGDRLKSMERENFSEKGKDYLDRILNAASRMQNLINDLLEFSRLSNPVPEFSRIDSNMILNEVISDMEITIERTGANIIQGKLPFISGNPTQIRQLFQNLISNAIKFVKEEETPSLKIYAKSSGKITHIFFEDNGIGFDEKYVDRIFTIFQRLENRKYAGTGIGLAICKKIALFHHGNIEVSSKPGQGSIFKVTLPLWTSK